MSFEDPRGSLPYSGITILPPTHTLGGRKRLTKLPSSQTCTVSKIPRCLDWIVSSATNVHVAVDKSTFKSYRPFETFVLAVSDQRRMSVDGIGEVELKIRCKPGSRETRTVHLDTVLHVPEWICNIFSDVHFHPEADFEHRWSDRGIRFMVKHNGRFQPWGYADEFCGLERLALSRKQRGRSPMLEDPDRELWSVSLHWPDSQRQRWHSLLEKDNPDNIKENKSDLIQAAETRLSLKPQINSPMSQQHRKNPSSAEAKSVSNSTSSRQISRVLNKQMSAISLDLERTTNRVSLSEINQNIAIPRESSVRASSLRATWGNRTAIRDLFHSPKKAQE